MFGNKTRLVKKLSERGGKVAWATILSTQKKWSPNQGSGRPGAGGSGAIHFAVTVRVEPEGEPTFEAAFKQAFSGWPPRDGWQCKVIYDPGNHDEIAILEESMMPGGISHDEAERAAERIAGHETSPGSAPTPGSTPTVDIADELTKLASLRDRGILTDAELEQQKQRILGER